MSRITINESSDADYHSASSEYDSDHFKNEARILEKQVQHMNESSQAADQSFLKIFKIGRAEFSYDESTSRKDD